MNLELDPTVAGNYRSASYVAGLATELWATNNLYCINCPSEILTREVPNSPVKDFSCPLCTATYQLKAKNGRHGRKVANSAFDQKVAAIDQGLVPHYAFLDYSRTRWKVTGLFIVPGHLIGRAVIQRRNPLGPNAKRAGWVGSNILLHEIPEPGRIRVVANGTISDPAGARRDWQRVAFLGNDPKASQGWGADVFSRAKQLVQDTGSNEFTLQSFYSRFLAELSELHPENRHVREKIRQLMQVLRNGGLLEFSDNRGQYRLLG